MTATYTRCLQGSLVLYSPKDPNENKHTMSQINPLDVLAIKNIVSRYCQALDLKDFDLLSKVFTPDVDANYPFNNKIQSLDELKEAIKNRYMYLILLRRSGI